MPRPVSRKKAAARAKMPSFSFTTRRLRGAPEETAAQREESERLKAEYLAKHGVKKK